MLAKIISH